MGRKQQSAWFFGWLVTRKGSDLSGNYGHKGRKGIRGGSMPGGGHMALGIAAGTPADKVRERIGQHRAKKKHEKAGFSPGLPGDTTREIDKRASGIFESVAPHWEYSSSITDLEIVDQKVANIAQLSGVDSDTVGNIMSTWSYTSNDQDLDAFQTQQAASELFGISLSTYQHNRMQETRDVYAPNPDQYLSYSKEDAKKVLQAMHDDTQRLFKEAGFEPGETVALFRGINEAYDYDMNIFKVGAVAPLEQNVISSWSFTPSIADKFIADEGGTIIKMNVPIENILSMGINGLGTTKEGEFVVLGVPGSQATVVEVLDL